MLDTDFLTGLKMPTRSQLYSLPISGTSGRDQETLLDYAQRLAVEHCVNVRDLFGRVILPVVNLPGLITGGSRFGQRYLLNCNGHNKYANQFLFAMEQLTMRSDLSSGTLIPWGPLIDPRCRGLLAPSRRWCPLCIDEQKVKGAIRHHLVWMVKAVDICPIHHTHLHSNCQICGNKQPNVHDAIARGNCTHCGASLSTCLLDGAPAAQATPKAIYIANAVSEMIGHASTAHLYAKPALLVQRLTVIAENLTGSSLYKLESLLKLPKKAIGNPGRRSLGLLLDISYRLNLTPLELLAGTKLPIIDNVNSHALFRQKTKSIYSIETALIEQVDECLQRALSVNNRITTKVQICNEVGILLSFFSSRFPQVVARLREHNNAIRPGIQRAAKDKRISRTKEAMQGLFSNGGPYTARAMNKAMQKKGVSRLDPELRSIANAFLNELRFPKAISPIRDQ